MKALTFRGKQTIAYESVPDPQVLDPADAVIEIRLAGLCGSDLHPYHERERGLDAGTVMGHEAVGVVVEIGSAVQRLAHGDLVFGPFTTSCGACFYCASGLTCRCERGQLFGWVEKGAGLHGLQAERARVPLADATLVKVPAGLAPEVALLFGDVAATGFYAADRAEVVPGATVAVVGCGPVGLMAVAAAVHRGARRVIALDSVPERLALAARFGAEPVDHRSGLSLGRGADSVIEAVGSPAAERLAISLVRPGGTLSVAGVHPENTFSFTPPEAYAKNLTYRVGRAPARAYIERLLPIAGRIDFGAIVTHRLPLAEGAEGYRLFDEKRDGCIKLLFTPR